MARIWAITAFMLSVALFTCQMFLFTDTEEQIVCGGLGVLVYALAVGKVIVPLGPSSTVVAVIWAVFSGILLGILPPRLRFGGNVGSLVLLFPLTHAVALVIFFGTFRKCRLPADPSVK